MIKSVDTFPFGYWLVRMLGDHRKARLLCPRCAERRGLDPTGDFVDPVSEHDPHHDCADCGTEYVDPEVPRP